MAKHIFMTNDQVLVDRIRAGDNYALQHLYKKYFPVIKRFITLNSGNEEDAEDIYQETITTAYEKIVHPDFKLSSSLKTFIYSISRYKWLYKLRQKGTGGVSFEDVENYIEDLDFTDDNFQSFDNESIDYDVLLKEALDKIDETCRKLLQHFYYDRFSLDVIAQKLGYNNANTAKAKKNKCMNKAKEIGKKLLEKFEV